MGGSALRGALAPWSGQLARVGLELVARRRSALEALQDEARALYPTLAGSGSVTLRYCGGLATDATEADVLAAFDDHLVEEARRAQTVAGPHRADLLIQMDEPDRRPSGAR